MTMDFYREHAEGPVDADDALLERLLMEKLPLCKIDSIAAAPALIDTADKLFVKAGWRLKSSSSANQGDGIPILESEHSLSSRPRPPARPSSYLSTPPRKRKQDSSSSPSSQARKRPD